MRVQKVYGPPGTGKTHELLELLDRELARGTPPERIAFVTFTVKARRVAQSRVKERFGFEDDRLPYFKTLHAIAFHQMELSRASMVKARELKAFSEAAGVEFAQTAQAGEDDDLASPGDGAKEGDLMLALDHLRRHRLLSPDGLLRTRPDVDVSPFTLRYFCRAYREWKEDEALLDFTDLLTSELDPLEVDAFFVDEAQDLSALQWRAVDTLSARAERMYMAGDDDQAIFTWAGAEPRDFLSRRADEERVLSISQRVPRRVHEVAAYVARGIHDRREKAWDPRDEEGEVDLLLEVDAWSPPPRGESTLVLYRNHYVAPQVEARLRDLGVPYRRHDRSEASTARWAHEIVLHERRRKGGELTPDEEQLVRDACTGEVDWEQPWFRSLTRIKPAEVQYLRAVLANYGRDGLLAEPDVQLSTVHAAKGGEAEHVVLMSEMSRRCAESLLSSNDEARVAYVGVTRARKTLTVVGRHPLLDARILRRS